MKGILFAEAMMMRLIMSTLAAIMALTGCSQAESGPPIFTRQAGTWMSEYQRLTPPADLSNPQARAQLSPAAFAQAQAQSMRPQNLDAPRCIDERQIFTADLYEMVTTRDQAGRECSFSNDERSEGRVMLEGTCQTNDGPSQVRVEIEYSPDRIATTFIRRAIVSPDAPSPREVRTRVTEIRTGDCT
jgi:hypothetical protein